VGSVEAPQPGANSAAGALASIARGGAVRRCRIRPRRGHAIVGVPCGQRAVAAVSSRAALGFVASRQCSG
jgi:hypothetical protein